MDYGHCTTWRRGWAILVALSIAGALTAARPYESPFLAECHDAMPTMMRAMHAPSRGGADADFAAMMVPHHQGAIDMARAELKYGTNTQLRRLAQEIIVTQQQEIAVMRAAAPEAFPLDSVRSHNGAVI